MLTTKCLLLVGRLFAVNSSWTRDEEEIPRGLEVASSNHGRHFLSQYLWYLVGIWSHQQGSRNLAKENIRHARSKKWEKPCTVLRSLRIPQYSYESRHCKRAILPISVYVTRNTVCLEMMLFYTMLLNVIHKRFTGSLSSTPIIYILKVTYCLTMMERRLIRIGLIALECHCHCHASSILILSPWRLSGIWFLHWKR